jgi:hypothetical protein
MLEQAPESQQNPEAAHLPGGAASVARKPFVPPTVQEIGGLSRLTQLGGTV